MTDGPTPFGRAVEAARKRRRLSVRQAAESAGISEGRWRQLVKGYQNAGGHQVPARPRDTTVVGMAQAVGLDVDEALGLAGFDPLTGTSLTPSRVIDDLAELLAKDPTLSEASREHIVNQYRLLQQLSALEVQGVAGGGHEVIQATRPSRGAGREQQAPMTGPSDSA